MGSLRKAMYIYGSNAVGLKERTIVDCNFSATCVRLMDPSKWKKDFEGRDVLLSEKGSFDQWKHKDSATFTFNTSISTRRDLRWWDKGMKSNWKEIQSADELVYDLLTAGDKLVVLEFYSPGCGGCKALHPKIYQLQELYPNVLILRVNYEEHRILCHNLNIHVLPFFRFYRGSQGKVCSFSCTVSTISKFKDALVKHGTERCDLGPAKGLDESEIRALASNGLLSLDFPSKPAKEMNDFELQSWKSYSSGIAMDEAKAEHAIH